MRYFLLFFLLCHFSASWADLGSSPLLGEAREPELVVYNRVLARVNGKTFSVVDVMKKMDLVLQKNYPHMMGSKAACYQFYSSQWKETLSQMINEELILADAAHLELKVTDADVREEIMHRFGPNVMTTLDTLNLTYEEAKQIVHSDLIIQQMMWFRVHAKALHQVTPDEIKLAYKDYCDKNPASTEWEYEVLALRTPNKNLGETLAHKACDLLHPQVTESPALDPQTEQTALSLGFSLATVAEKLRQDPVEGVAISVNSDLKADDRTIAKSHRDVLETLKVGDYSSPIAQLSRSDQSVVHRIFHLKNVSSRPVPSFQKMSNSLKEELLMNASNKEQAQYIAKLKSKLGFDEKELLESLPADFQPFALR